MASGSVKHREIFESLRGQIEAGRYAGARRLPSEAQLAARFGVSRPTAARALRDLQSLGLLERRVGSGTYLRQAPLIRSDQASRTFGLLVPGLGNTEILDPICNEITRCAQTDGHAVLWGAGVGAANSPAEAEQVCREYIDRKISGVFFAPFETIPDRQTWNIRITTLLHEAGIAVVLLDRDILEFPSRSRFDLVGIDNFHAGLTLANHLLDGGNRRLRFLARPEHPSTTDLRIAGCREALARRNLPVPARFANFGDPTDRIFVRQLLRPERPDVIICANDLTAALLIQTLTGLGLRLPDDIGVAGFDDVKYATLLAVPLTTMRQPYQDIARSAVHLMQDRLNHPTLPPRQITLPAELIARQSCRHRK